MTETIPNSLLAEIRKRIIVPLKDAMRLKEYKESDRKNKFHIYKKVKGSNKEIVFRSHSFKISGTLKHEMYLKAINPLLIKKVVGKDYKYKLIITPNKPINLDFDNKNKRKIELIVYFKKGKLKV